MSYQFLEIGAGNSSINYMMLFIKKPNHQLNFTYMLYDKQCLFSPPRIYTNPRVPEMILQKYHMYTVDLYHIIYTLISK